LKRAIKLLKEKPVLILFYTVYLVVMLMIMFLLYPHDMRQFMEVEDTFELIQLFKMLMNMFIAVILMIVLGILFMAGFGGMVAEACVTGKTYPSSFGKGIQRYGVRTLLAYLLLIVFSVVVSLFISLITIPFVILNALSIVNTVGVDSSSLSLISMIPSLISMVIIIFIAPFILLWFPAIYIDNIGVMEGLKRGAKSGVKNYWKLMLAVFVVYIPMGIYLLFEYKTMSNGIIFPPSFIVVTVVDSFLALIMIPYLYYIYKNTIK